MEAKKESSGQPSLSPRRRRLLRWGVIGLAIVVALVAWLATKGGDDDGGGGSETPATAEAVPRVVDVDGLREAAADLEQPIYWAGPIGGEELQLVELGEGGGVQVIYVPEGTGTGEAPARSLTVGSYPLADPTKAVEGFGERPGATVKRASDGREVVASAEAPTSVYFADPENVVQVEVYDPSPRQAMSLALSGQVQPVG